MAAPTLASGPSLESETEKAGSEADPPEQEGRAGSVSRGCWAVPGGYTSSGGVKPSGEEAHAG